MNIWLRTIFALAACVMPLGTTKSTRALSLHAGDVVTFNADFTGATPPPPYLTVTIMRFSFTDVDAGDLATFDIFDGLNHSGALLADLPQQQVAPDFGFFGGVPGLLDGVFSIRMAVGQGEFTLQEVWAEAYNDSSGTPSVTIPVAFAVPEPSSLALFGTVMAGAALRRGRRNRQD